MALPTSYMTGNYSKIPKYFEAIINAQAPEKFTVKFLKDLDFKSSTDTQFVNVLKMLGFLDDSGVPTERYFQIFDRTQSRKLVADGIREAYCDLFMLNTKANEMDRSSVKAKFKQLTEGKKSDSTITQMTSTFVALCEYADWTQEETIEQNQNLLDDGEADNNSKVSNQSMESTNTTKGIDLCYDIHIHLPATRDERVYDVLFTSLKKHLL